MMFFFSLNYGFVNIYPDLSVDNRMLHFHLFDPAQLKVICSERNKEKRKSFGEIVDKVLDLGPRPT